MAEPDTPVMKTAKQQYETRLAYWRDILGSEDKRYGQVSDIRLWTVIVGLVAAWLSPWYIVGPVVLFVGLIVWHVRIDERRIAARRGIAYFESGLQRLDGKWAGKGSSGERFLTTDHVYAGDQIGRASCRERVSYSV